MRRSAFYIALPLATLFGCGGPRYYPIEGQVVWAETGTAAIELKGGFVEFESADHLLSGRGEIGPDGRFQIMTVKPNDGLPPGEYGVVVIQPPSQFEKPERLIDVKYERFAHSGLKAQVQARSKNPVSITVERPKPKS